MEDDTNNHRRRIISKDFSVQHLPVCSVHRRFIFLLCSELSEFFEKSLHSNINLILVSTILIFINNFVFYTYFVIFLILCLVNFKRVSFKTLLLGISQEFALIDF